MAQSLSEAELKKTVNTFKETGSKKEAARKLGIRPKTVTQRLTTACRKGLTSMSELRQKPTQSCSLGSSSVMNREQFMTKYDIRTRQEAAIKEGVKRLKEMANDRPEDDPILGDQEFKQECCGGVLSQGFRSVAEQREFLQYQFKVGEKVFWTTPRTKKWALANVSRARDLNDVT